MSKIHLITFKEHDNGKNKTKLEKHLEKHASKRMAKKPKMHDELKNTPRVFIIEDANEELLEDLRNDPDVMFVEEDSVVYPAMAQSPAEWSHTMMDITAFHSRGYTGAGVKVGYLDTGAAPHEDLVYAGTYNANSTTVPAGADSHGHGTKVAGIIGMRNNTLGYVGIAPDCLLYGVKVDSNDGSGAMNSSAILKGTDWLVGQGVKIISCSFGSATNSSTRETQWRDHFNNNGVLFVCAAMNEANGGQYATDPDPDDCVFYPGKYDFVITVGCVTDSGRIAAYSSRGKAVDVSAVGDGVMSTRPSEANYAGTDWVTPSTLYSSFSGTSCATPHAAGILALYKQMYPNYTATQLRNVFESNVIDYGAEGQDIAYGKGMLVSPWTSKTVTRATLTGSSVSGTLVAGKPIIYKYVPTVSGKYTLTTSGAITPRVDAYGVGGNRVTGYNSTSPTVADFVAGNTYYIGVYGFPYTQAGSFTLSLSKTGELASGDGSSFAESIILPVGTVASSIPATTNKYVIFRFVAPSAGSYTFETWNAAIDLKAELYNVNLDKLASSDNEGNGSNPMFTRTLAANEVVYIKVMPYSSSNTGAFDMKATAGTSGGTGSIRKTEDFEGSMTTYTWSGDWDDSKISASTGSWSYKSYAIGHGGSSQASFTETIPTTGVSPKVIFDYRVSSEQNYDFFEVMVNGVSKLKISGSTGWVLNHEIALGTGSQTVTFKYYKDGSSSAGDDAAFIDNVRISY
ncbi:S8 family peptidase [Brevibacillus formosus]|uniref:S8 family peptidase n=1 Tax=Brevibacillus formosus TaxID=54913 RepID=UPI003F1B8350